ncbi:MAG: hypothetical protein ABSD31_06600 [Candidatus Binataceae bacterium]|jgi:hypothetical protein
MRTRAQRSLPDVDALRVREVDALVSRLLEEIQVSFDDMGAPLLNRIVDLKRVLSADYREAPGRPPKPLLHELARIVELEIKPNFTMLSDGWDKSELLTHLTEMFGPREIEVRAEPYRRGAGLSLRGFFCRADSGANKKFVIFLNTAHLSGAVAATFGHELGHYVHGSLVGEHQKMAAFMEGTFAKHLTEEGEFFADSLVALAAYSRDLIKRIGLADDFGPGKSEAFFNRIKEAYGFIGHRFHDFGRSRLATASRMRYLTSMIHFFKLRRALLEYADL